MIRLGTLQPDGSAVLAPDEVKWLRDLFGRMACAYQVQAVPRRYDHDEAVAAELTDRARERAALALGELVAEDGPSGYPGFLGRVSSLDCREVVVRAMMVRGGFPPGEPLMSRSVHRVMPDAAIMAEVPGAWITDGPVARRQGPTTPPEADVIPIRPLPLDFVSTETEED
ncbi:hypothetical protein TMCBR2_gp040c [Caulobacter phage TMCBR2]|uniref:Uncharacterized protein n=1 Tax=Caulobacter phage TMCBR2 TaxID=3025404 RepID=A0AAF0BYL6_9CAUD|nr:hypothetical protein TMCBR2_gp040c [Caulobacter phage TMCBR2]